MGRQGELLARLLWSMCMYSYPHTRAGCVVGPGTVMDVFAKVVVVVELERKEKALGRHAWNCPLVLSVVVARHQTCSGTMLQKDHSHVDRESLRWATMIDMRSY